MSRIEVARSTLRSFRAAGFKYGDVVPHEWFYEHFGLEQPKPDTPYRTASRAKLDYMTLMDEFQEDLLETDRIALRSIAGKGYEVVPPSEQTRWAVHEAGRALRKEQRRAESRLRNINREALTDAERAQNDNAIARLTLLRQFTRKQLRWGFQAVADPATKKLGDAANE